MKKLLYTIQIIFFEFFYRLTNNNNSPEFAYPEKIGDFSFVKSKEVDEKKIFKFGFYKKGKQIGFAKILNYTNKNFDYFSLINEYKFYKILNQNSKKIKSDIKIPKLLKFIKEKNRVILMTEWIEGQEIKNLPLSKKIEIYKKIIHFCHSITPFIEHENNIFVNTLKKIAIIFPFLLVISCFKNPKKILTLLETLKIYLKNLPILLKKHEYVFVHKSLEDQNILYKKNQLYLIDFQLSSLSYSMSELSQILLFSWHKKDFISAVLQDSFFQEMIGEDNNKSVLQINSIYLGLVQLLGGHTSKDICFSFIEYFTQLNFEQRTPYEQISSFVFNLVSFTRQTTKKLNNNIILCYHSINNHPWRFATHISEFEKQIEYVKRNYTITSLDNILRRNSKNLAAITFDDGYLDIIQYAYPILEKNKIKATLFVLGDRDQANRKELDNKLPLLSLDQIRFLHKKGWEIGFHTNTHANLATLSKHELEQEIILSKKKLEGKLGFPIKYFAYPRGIYNKEIIEVVKKAQYNAAFTVDGGSVNFKNMQLVPRVPMEGTISINEFAGLLSPLGLILSQLFMSILKFKENMSMKLL